jgi:hypothetical protein
VQLKVTSTNAGAVLTGTVRFHLHPTFVPSKRDVVAVNNEAVLNLIAYGAFTVGAELFDPKIVLELDLATVSGAPTAFRNA